MPNYKTNPLFARSAQRIKEQARREFLRTDTGQLITEARRVLRSSHQRPEQIGNVIRKFGRRAGGRSMIDHLRGSEVGKVVSQVEQYARGGGVTKAVISSFLKELGPAGKLISALVGAKSKTKLQSDLEAAVAFLEAFGPESGYEVKKTKTGKPKRPPSIGYIDRKAAEARELLESLGYRVMDPGEEAGPERAKDRLPFNIPGSTAAGRKRRVVDLKVAGAKRRFPVGHPIVTGEMVRTPESSNVYAYGYDIETRNLYVRFRAPGETDKTGARPNRAGPLYSYAHVPPEIFLRFLQAPSKGVWIWDNVRIRGTLSGHQYDYLLVGVTGDYVPRKVTLGPEGEEYRQRTVLTNRGRELTSRLPNAMARPLGGTPNRGTPNRGQPNTGAP